jgi:hypothetical protein
MSEQTQLQEWLSACQKQLRIYTRWRAATVAGAALLVITLVAAWVGFRSAYSAESMFLLRALLVLALAGAGVLLLWLPLKRINHHDGVDIIEEREPSFDGRLRTLEELRKRDEKHPMTSLLVKDVLNRSANVEPASLVEGNYLKGFRVATVMTALALVWLVAFAPGNWSFGARNYLLGWAFRDLVPAQSIGITPGDRLIKRGTAVSIEAEPQGFAPAQAILFAQYDGEPWQEVPMQRGSDGQFSFRFYGVQDELTYYVSAAGVASQRFQIGVVDVPTIEQISLEYNYPDWTGLEGRTQEFGTHIQGVEGTEVTLIIQSDRPLNAGEMIVNDQPLSLESEGNISRVSLALSEPGEYYLTDQFDGELIRLTEDYAIRLLADGSPTITPVKPGGDWSASNIEEVSLRFRAEDDYQVTNARLFYSVNGGDWIQRELDASGKDVELEHLLFLENMAAEENGLVPGDLISYFIEVDDHQQVVSSDIYFIDVQPFEKRYSQSQSAGGGGGGGGGAGAGGGGEDEISARQREILVATFNLNRERTGDETVDPQYLEDNADMLSELQLTLAEQTDTMIQRAQARGLDTADSQNRRFIENLEEALVAMEPAVTHLDAVELEDSIPAQQKALQFLLRAESVFRDIQVSMNNAGGGGGGGSQAERDMASIYELEMDLSQNQYETRQSASLQEPEAALDDAFNELEDLARRQEQLAQNAQRNNGMSLSERWQQDQLRREAEELREQLEQLQQQSGQQQGNDAQQAAAENLQRQLDNVIDSMRQASGEPQSGQQGQPNQSGQSGQQGQAGQAGNSAGQANAAAAASEQLRQTLDELGEARQNEISNSLESFKARVQQLREQQAQLDERLQQSLADAMAERRASGTYTDGLSAAEQNQLTDQKRDMAEEVRALEQDITRTENRIEEDMPATAVTLRGALDLIRVTRLEERLDDAANSIESGLAPAAASREATTTDILERLQGDLNNARQLAANELNQSSSGQQQVSAEEQIRQLREQLSSNLTQGQAQGEGQGQANQGGQQGSAGGNGGGFAGDINGPRGGGDWAYRERGALPEDFRSAEVGDQAAATSSQLLALSNDLVQAGVSTEQLLEAQRLARQLALQSGNDQETIAALQSLVSQLERLELEISSAENIGETSLPVRGANDTEVEMTESVADYFRRLSERPYE